MIQLDALKKRPERHADKQTNKQTEIDMLVLDKNLSWLWFETVRLLSQQYGLPDPLLILQSPPTHYYWKKLTKLMVFDWWPTKFRSEIDLS